MSNSTVGLGWSGKHMPEGSPNLAGSVITFQAPPVPNSFTATNIVNQPEVAVAPAQQFGGNLPTKRPQLNSSNMPQKLGCRPEAAVFSLETLDNWAVSGYETATNKVLRTICYYREIPVSGLRESRHELLEVIEAWDEEFHECFEVTDFTKRNHMEPVTKLSDCTLSWLHQNDEEENQHVQLPSGFFCTRESICGRVMLRTTKMVFFRKWKMLFLVISKNSIELYRSRRAWEMGLPCILKHFVDPLLEVTRVLPHDPWSLGGSWKPSHTHMFKLIRQHPKVLAVRSQTTSREFSPIRSGMKSADFIPPAQTICKFGSNSNERISKLAVLVSKWIQHQPANNTGNNFDHDPWSMAKGYSPFVA